jgi:hypothetical protein
MADELTFGLHHALHVLKGFEARARRDVPVGGAALSVEPFFAFADLLRVVLALQITFSGGFFAGVRRRRWRRLFFGVGGFFDERTSGTIRRARFFLGRSRDAAKHQNGNEKEERTRTQP